MEIVAFNEDDKADGSGKAKITWISKDLLDNSYLIAPTNGKVWTETDLRNILQTTIKSLIPQEIRNSIVEVTKYSYTYVNGVKTRDGVVSNDDIWIPSARELYSSYYQTDAEISGPAYYATFNRDRLIKKQKGKPQVYWLRSMDKNVNNFYRSISITGDEQTTNSNNAQGVILGFCTN